MHTPAHEEIRALFPNEVECLAEGEALIAGTYLVFSRTVRLAGMNTAEGKTCISHIVYAIHPDGYWEQIAAHNGDWL